jgi:hypothetical protein
MRKTMIIFCIVLILLLGGLAGAGITNLQNSWIDNAELISGTINWLDSDSTLQLLETWGTMGSVTSSTIGEADVDPIIHISKQINNNSGFTWTDYHIQISGQGSVYIPGSATSDRFSTIAENGNNIDFFSPLTVPVNDSVTLGFDIQVASGIFSFSISQMPTPEPATICLLGLGALTMIRRRRSAAANSQV